MLHKTITCNYCWETEQKSGRGSNCRNKEKVNHNRLEVHSSNLIYNISKTWGNKEVAYLTIYLNFIINKPFDTPIYRIIETKPFWQHKFYNSKEISTSWSHQTFHAPQNQKPTPKGNETKKEKTLSHSQRLQANNPRKRPPSLMPPTQLTPWRIKQTLRGQRNRKEPSNKSWLANTKTIFDSRKNRLGTRREDPHLLPWRGETLALAGPPRIQEQWFLEPFVPFPLSTQRKR